MYKKIIGLIVNAYLVSKASYPPSQDVSTKKVISTEGRLGIIIGSFVPKSTIIFIIMQALIYIYMIYLQEIGSIPILSHKISEWNLLETVLFWVAIGGTSLRLWCFKCLKEYFTFNITVKKNHKLITTGPYSLIVHPAVSYILFY